MQADQAKRQAAQQYRASDLGFLSLYTAQYLSLLDWTGHQVRQDKRGSIPAESRRSWSGVDNWEASTTYRPWKICA